METALEEWCVRNLGAAPKDAESFAGWIDRSAATSDLAHEAYRHLTASGHEDLPTVGRCTERLRFDGILTADLFYDELVTFIGAHTRGRPA